VIAFVVVLGLFVALNVVRIVLTLHDYARKRAHQEWMAYVMVQEARRIAASRNRHA
jgi:hypothetical protein